MKKLNFKAGLSKCMKKLNFEAGLFKMYEEIKNLKQDYKGCTKNISNN